MFHSTRLRILAIALCMAALRSATDGAALAAEEQAAPAGGSDEVRLLIKNYDELMQLIASKRGKIVVADLWSTYCIPCLKEFPGLVRLHRQHSPDKLACLSVCVNFSGLGKPEDEVAEPLKFLKAQGAAFDNVLCGDPDETLYKKLRITSVPTILVFGRDGKLLKVFENEVSYAQVEAFVVPLLTEK